MLLSLPITLDLLLTMAIKRGLQHAYIIMANKAKEPIVASTVNFVNVITCGIKSVQVYGTGDSAIRYRVALDVAINAIKKDLNTDQYIEAQVDYIDFVPRVLIAQCINQIDGLDLMYTKKKEQGLRNDNAAGFGAAELQVLLRGAKLDIERTKFVAGSEYTDKDDNVQVHENAGYNTNIIKIKVSDRVQTKLDDMIDKVFDL